MRAFNKSNKPKHFTNGRVVKYNICDNFHYVNHLSTKKIGLEYIEADKWIYCKYNLVRIVKKVSLEFRDGNWYSAREDREFNEFR